MIVARKRAIDQAPASAPSKVESEKQDRRDVTVRHRTDSLRRTNRIEFATDPAGPRKIDPKFCS